MLRVVGKFVKKYKKRYVKKNHQFFKLQVNIRCPLNIITV